MERPGHGSQRASEVAMEPIERDPKTTPGQSWCMARPLTTVGWVHIIAPRALASHPEERHCTTTTTDTLRSRAHLQRVLNVRHPVRSPGLPCPRGQQEG